MAHIPGKFIWFEYNGSNAAAAKAFYSEVFAWKFDDVAMPDPYTMIKAGDKAIGGIGRAGGPSRWLPYLSVADVDAARRAVTAGGGKTLGEAFDIPTVGRMALVTDPHGAEVWLMRGQDSDEPDGQVPVGAFCWNELSTPDPVAAVAFYEKAFGFTHEAMDMGPAGTYRILQAGLQGRGGVTTGKGTASWLPYVMTDGADAAVDRAKRSRGSVEVPPTDIPGVGRFAILVDPTGARLGILQPAPQAAKP